MPTYVYESIPRDAGEHAERFEFQQKMSEPPLERHPTTGIPLRRVVSGGLGYLAGAPDGSLPELGPGCGPGACGCGRFS